MRQAGRAVTFHFLQLQGCSRALYPFQGLRAANPRSEASKASSSINLQFRDADNEAGGAGGAGAWPQRQPEQAHKAGTGENIVHDIAKEIHSISHHRDILCDMSYDIACDIAS